MDIYTARARRATSSRQLSTAKLMHTYFCVRQVAEAAQSNTHLNESLLNNV